MLDTHVAIWAATTPNLISERGRELIGDWYNDVFVSAASIWEIAIKHSLKRRDAPPFSAADAIETFDQMGFRVLPTSAVHAAAIENIKLPHRDPFDRLILAQALTEPLTLLTHHVVLSNYTDSVVRV